MFGQEPRLPVDFLVGVEREQVDLSLEDWVMEHQKSLAVAYGTVQKRLEARRAQQGLKDENHRAALNFVQGDLVYTRN